VRCCGVLYGWCKGTKVEEEEEEEEEDEEEEGSHILYVLFEDDMLLYI